MSIVTGGSGGGWRCPPGVGIVLKRQRSAVHFAREPLEDVVHRPLASGGGWSTTVVVIVVVILGNAVVVVVVMRNVGMVWIVGIGEQGRR